jgi:nitrate reductase delta subunit
VLSLLLEYPTEQLVTRIPLLRAAAQDLPPDVSRGLLHYLEDLAGTDLRSIQADYVDTFDVTRKCSLHLTYFTHGDTRKRGVALVAFKQAFRQAGVQAVDDELPDYLPVVLEFGAAYDRDIAWKLLNDHRVGIELLATALRRRQSRWSPVVESLRATLPHLDDDDEVALAKLIAQGPPQESVGLDQSGYGQDLAMDPRLNPRPAPFPIGVTP